MKRRPVLLLFLSAAALLASAPCGLAQQIPPRDPTGRASPRNSSVGGSAPGARSSGPSRLTLADAIGLGLRKNLGVLLAGSAIREAQGAEERSRSALLPKAEADVPVTLQSRDLRAFGISLPVVPQVVGPFGTYDFRAYFSEPVVDLESYRHWKSSEKQEQASKLDYQDVRERTIRQVAGLYLQAESAAARVKAAASRVDTAQALDDLAEKQHGAGVATGVDVLRAQVALANERQNLVEARNAAEQALLALERSIGIDPGAPVVLAETLEFRSFAPPAADAAVAQALAARPDVQALEAQRQAILDQQAANRARYLPRLGIDANYGGIGRTLSDVRQTVFLSATLRFTLFDGDRSGERTQIDSRLQGIDAQLADLRRGIAGDVRSALLDLQSAAEAVSVARQGEDLAGRELKLARDRFRAGVTDNVEVVTAQDSLARAQENYIFALTQHVDAKIALARALGETEKGFERYVGAP